MRAIEAIASHTSIERHKRPKLSKVQIALVLVFLTSPESRGGVSQSLHISETVNYFSTAKAHLAKFKKQNPGVSIPLNVDSAEARRLITSL